MSLYTEVFVLKFIISNFWKEQQFSKLKKWLEM